MFIAKDSGLNISTINRLAFENSFAASNQQYDSIIGIADPDLSKFRNAGGKMLTWHSLADNIIPPQGTTNYYDRVAALDPSVSDYYRYFQAPGIEHCTGGPSAYPWKAFDSLVEWVENGRSPTTLGAMSLPINGTISYRDLCMYPWMTIYTRGDPTLASSYDCVPTRLGRTGAAP